MILQSIENKFAMIATDGVSNSAFDVWIFNWILRYISHKWQLFYSIFALWWINCKQYESDKTIVSFYSNLKNSFFSFQWQTPWQWTYFKLIKAITTTKNWTKIPLERTDKICAMKRKGVCEFTEIALDTGLKWSYHIWFRCDSHEHNTAAIPCHLFNMHIYPQNKAQYKKIFISHLKTLSFAGDFVVALSFCSYAACLVVWNSVQHLNVKF